jgi:hypothetical protein
MSVASNVRTVPESGLADPGGVEILVGQTAAEAEQRPYLDSAGVRGRTGRDLDRGRTEGNALVDRAASADHGAGGQAQVRGENVVAGRAVEELVNPDPRLGKPVAMTTRILALTALGQTTARWNGIPSVSPLPGFLGFDVDGAAGGAAARIDARRVEDEGVCGVTDSGEVSAPPGETAGRMKVRNLGHTVSTVVCYIRANLAEVPYGHFELCSM